MRRAGWIVVAVLTGAVAYALSRPDVRAGIGSVSESAGGFVLDFVAKITGEQAENRARFLPLIQQAEAENGLPPGLLDRVLYQESRYRSDIIEGRTVSGAGAVGIAQIVPRWHPTVDPLDTSAAIFYAARYLAQHYRRFGTWSLALAAYNWGQGNQNRDLADGIIGNEWPDETRRYVAEITADVEVA